MVITRLVFSTKRVGLSKIMHCFSFFEKKKNDDSSKRSSRVFMAGKRVRECSQDLRVSKKHLFPDLETEAPVVCAIDFGTARTGYAYVFTKQPGISSTSEPSVVGSLVPRPTPCSCAFDLCVGPQMRSRSRSLGANSLARHTPGVCVSGVSSWKV